MRQLTSLDAQFLTMETPRTVGHVSGLAVLDPSTAPGGELTSEALCALIEERLHLVPPFRWRLAPVPLGLDHPYWIEDPDFDLDFHIRETAVPPPGGDRQLAELVARICARPLDRAHPLWELYVIHGLRDGRVGVLTKVHHAAVDGMSGAEIMSILYDLDPAGREIPQEPVDSVGSHVPGQVELLGRALLGLPRPLKTLAMLPATLPRLDSVPIVGALPGALAVSRVATRISRLGRGTNDGGVLERTNVRAPRTRFNGRISPHRRFAFASLSLDRIKAIKSAAGVTVNDAVVAVCAGGLRTWLDDRGELPSEPLVSMVPVSVRTREEMGTFGNRVSTMFVPIPTDEPDPHRRLQRAHEILASAKERHRALPADLLADASQFIPPALAARAARVTSEVLSSSRMAPLLNLVISNVPGPREPLYCAGARLEHNYPVSVITDGVGLNITCLSYLDRVDFGIVCCREMVDDAWSIMAAIERELELVDEAICGPRPTPAPRAADPVAGR
jgi:WS/DGAT/MGAT family acyltransferase